MGNYWVYQQKTAKELDLRGNIHREYNNLEYLRKMRYNLDYKADSTAMIQSLENLLEESRRQHSFEIANYENQIAELLAENEKLNLEEQNQRLASQLEQLEMKLLQSGDMEVLKVKVDNLELENQSLKAILGKSRQRVAELEPLSTKVEELTQENEALKVQLSEYDTSIADLPEITKERDRLRAQVKDLKKELDNLQIENDSMRVKMNYMKDSNDANQEKIRLCIDVKKQLESQLDEVTTNYNHVSLENEGLSAKIRLLDQTIDKLKTEVKESVKTSKVLKETAAKSDDHIRNLKSQIDDLVMKHREAESKLDKVTKEARDLHRQNRQLQADLEAKPCQEQPNILKETFRRHKKKIEDLQSENNALREEIKHLQDDMEATVSQRIESYHMKLQAVEEEKMALIRKVYDLQSKVRELEAEWETKSTVSSGRIFEDLSTHTIMPVSSELKLRLDSPMQSPDMSPRELISPRELFKIKRHSLHDSRRGLTMEGEKEPVAGPSRGLTMEGEKEPVAGPSRESGRRFTQAEWDDMQEIYVKELTMKDSELFDLRANDILQGRRIKELEKEVEQLKNLVEPKGPADLLSSEPFKYNDKAARMEQIARLNAEIEILKTKLKKMEEVKRENTALNAVNEANTEHLSKLLTDLTDSKKLCSKYSQQLEAAKEELKTANDRLRIMQRSQEDCQSKMISFQSMLQSTEMQLREKEERIEQLEMDLARLETRSATPRGTPASFDDHKKHIEREVEVLKKDKATKEQQIQNLELRLKHAEEQMGEVEKKYMGKQIAEEDHKKTVEKLQYKIDKLKMLAQMRRKENLELRQLLGLGEEDVVPPLKK
ncbi:unnamed protein product [Callosobruchus maculatus]|uniref:Uncharacterized protein n=1 Tax=Callosobruchus maculatus TaxID=64391 RepID=A0A653D9I9_CALMS|nr:unnamed protein product [Callosobruchus maculatus]